MGKGAYRYQHIHHPLDPAARDFFVHSGKLFSGSPPLKHVIRLELLQAIAACLRRNIHLSELKQLYRVDKFETELVGGRKVRMVHYAVIPKHLQGLINSRSGVSVALARKDVIWAQVPLPVGQFSGERLYESVMRFKKGSGGSERKFPHRTDHRRGHQHRLFTGGRSSVRATLRQMASRGQ